MTEKQWQEKVYANNRTWFDKIPAKKILGTICGSISDSSIQKLSLEKRNNTDTNDLTAICIDHQKWVVFSDL